MFDAIGKGGYMIHPPESVATIVFDVHAIYAYGDAIAVPETP
jgi:hypothetical protein